MTGAGFTLDPEEIVKELLAADGDVDADTITTAISRAGRVHGPWIVSMLAMVGRLTPAAAASVVSAAWSDAEYPMNSLRQAEWRELFALAGYTDGGVPAHRPDVPLVLYRGSPAKLRRRWAWTDQLVQARRFASDGMRGRLVGEVWTARVEPWRLLAHISDRDECEYVIDTKGLAIRRATRRAPSDG